MKLAFENFEEMQSSPAAYQGYSEDLRGWAIPYPVNPHTHLRDPELQKELFELAVPETAKRYAWATAMPNLKTNRIRTPEQALEYRERIVEIGRRYNPNFDVTVPLYVEPDTDPQIVLEGFKRGAWKTMKIYPKSGTTNSDEGVDFRRFPEIYPVLDMAQKLGMLVLVHGEQVHRHDGNLLDDRLREQYALPWIGMALQEFPNMRLVFEHLSSEAAVGAVKSWRLRGYRVEATIAPQYLIWNSTKLFEKGMNPVAFSIPILKTESDRLALTKFVLEGGGMLGTDSAPHDIRAKSKPEGCPGGVFNEPTSLFTYFHVFRSSGRDDWFEKFVAFSSEKASAFYDRPPVLERIIIREEPWEVPALYINGDTQVIPMFAGETMPYSAITAAA